MSLTPELLVHQSGAPSDGIQHPEPGPVRVAPRTRPDPGLRAVDHPRHRRRDLDRREALGGPRRAARRGVRRGRVGGAVRRDRRPDLPRHHRLAPLLRRRRQPRRGAVHLARRPRGLGCDLARRGRRADRLPVARHQDAADGRRPGPRRARRPGDRPVGQLVQPGAVRQAHRPAVGAADRPRVTGRPATRTSPPSTRRTSTSSSGTSSPSPSSSGSTGGSGSATAGCSRST